MLCVTGMLCAQIRFNVAQRELAAYVFDVTHMSKKFTGITIRLHLKALMEDGVRCHEKIGIGTQSTNKVPNFQAANHVYREAAGCAI